MDEWTILRVTVVEARNLPISDSSSLRPYFNLRIGKQYGQTRSGSVIKWIGPMEGCSGFVWNQTFDFVIHKSDTHRTRRLEDVLCLRLMTFHLTRKDQQIGKVDLSVATLGNPLRSVGTDILRVTSSAPLSPFKPIARSSLTRLDGHRRSTMSSIEPLSPDMADNERRSSHSRLSAEATQSIDSLSASRNRTAQDVWVPLSTTTSQAQTLHAGEVRLRIVLETTTRPVENLTSGSVEPHEELEENKSLHFGLMRTFIEKAQNQTNKLFQREVEKESSRSSLEGIIDPDRPVLFRVEMKYGWSVPPLETPFQLQREQYMELRQQHAANEWCRLIPAFKHPLAFGGWDEVITHLDIRKLVLAGVPDSLQEADHERLQCIDESMKALGHHEVEIGTHHRSLSSPQRPTDFASGARFPFNPSRSHHSTREDESSTYSRCLLSQLHVAIPSFHISREATLGPIAFYRVEVIYFAPACEQSEEEAVLKWHVIRRYSDFDLLTNFLTNDCGGERLKELIPETPKSLRSVLKVTMTPEFLEDRRFTLERTLVTLLRAVQRNLHLEATDEAESAMMDFLGLPRRMFPISNSLAQLCEASFKLTAIGMPHPKHNFRIFVWMLFAGTAKRLVNGHMQQYSAMLQEMEQTDPLTYHTSFQQIELDIARTKVRETPGMDEGESLRRLLRTFVVSRPSVGYCQAMNYVALFLLRTADSREDWAFGLLLALSDDIIPQYWTPSMSAIQADMRVLNFLVKSLLPDLYAHFNRIHLPLDLFATQWLVSLFTYSLPPNTICRVWDWLVLDGPLVLLCTTLAILRRARATLIHQEDLQTCAELLQMEAASSYDADLLLSGGQNELIIMESKGISIRSLREQMLLQVQEKVARKERSKRMKLRAIQSLVKVVEDDSLLGVKDEDRHPDSFDEALAREQGSSPRRRAVSENDVLNDGEVVSFGSSELDSQGSADQSRPPELSRARSQTFATQHASPSSDFELQQANLEYEASRGWVPRTPETTPRHSSFHRAAILSLDELDGASIATYRALGPVKSSRIVDLMKTVHSNYLRVAQISSSASESDAKPARARRRGSSRVWKLRKGPIQLSQLQFETVLKPVIEACRTCVNYDHPPILEVIEGIFRSFRDDSGCITWSHFLQYWALISSCELDDKVELCFLACDTFNTGQVDRSQMLTFISYVYTMFSLEDVCIDSPGTLVDKLFPSVHGQATQCLSAPQLINLAYSNQSIQDFFLLQPQLKKGIVRKERLSTDSVISDASWHKVEPPGTASVDETYLSGLGATRQKSPPSAE